VIKHWRACRRRRCPPGRSPRNAVIFGAACRSCPLRQRCTTAKHGRTLHLHEHEGLLRAARAEWAGLRLDYMTPRPQVGRAIAQMATWRGRRLMLRYREVTSNNAWLKRRTAAVNLRSLLGRGLTRRDGVWALATCPGCHRQARHHGQPGKKTTAPASSHGRGPPKARAGLPPPDSSTPADNDNPGNPAQFSGLLAVARAPFRLD